MIIHCWPETVILTLAKIPARSGNAALLGIDLSVTRPVGKTILFWQQQSFVCKFKLILKVFLKRDKWFNCEER